MDVKTGTTTQEASPPAGTTPAPTARGTLVVADDIVTLGHGRHSGRALVIRGSRVVWVGDDPAMAPPHGATLDLSGCVLGPAFVDAHVRMTPAGMAVTGLDVAGVRTRDDLLRAVRNYADQHTGRVIWGLGFDPYIFVGDLPTAEELSTAALGMAVFLSRVDGHSCLTDASTLRAAPLARAHGMETDDEGRPTGILRREAHKIVRRWSVGAMTEIELDAARRAISSRCASLGVASVHEMNGPDQMGSTDFDAWLHGRWPIDVVGYWGSFDLGFAAERDLRQIGGALHLDGSLGSHTAALAEPYADAPGSGVLEHEDTTLIEFFLAATQAGMQVAVHAVGDAALRQVVRCWQAVEASLPEHLGPAASRLRHRVEHAEVLPPDLRPAFAELGLTVSGQPLHEMAWGGPDGMYASRLGPERIGWTNPYRELADLGVSLTFGSATSTGAMDPWDTVWAAEHRSDPAHAMDRLEAVSASTLGGRAAARQDRFVGTVRAGMRADLAAWEGNPYTADDPRGTRCALTTVRGRVTHGDGHPLPRWNAE